MSHFTVAVLSRFPNDVEGLLEPYNEDPSDPEYLEFVPATETMNELRAKYRENEKSYVDFEDFLSQYYGYSFNDEHDKVGCTCNPNAKWDWWRIGGRWPGELRLKEGCCGSYGPDTEESNQVAGRCDQARLGDVDFSPDPATYKAAKRFWEVYVEGKALRKGEKRETFESYWKPEYFIEQYHDKETYARSVSEFSVWALVTPDGEWHEQGEMGWFGFSNATFDSRKSFMEQLQQALVASDPELYITIVDCHI